MNILIALDSSPTAQAALEAALARDWPEATNFRVLTVMPKTERLRGDQKGISPALYSAYTLLDAAAQKIEIANPDSISTAQFAFGDPAKCILKHARDWPADLIIVGSHDRGPVERLFLGSVSRAVFQDADCSVLIARDVHKSAEINRVLVSIDDSYNSQLAVEAVLASKWPKNTYFKLVSAAVVDHGLFAYQPNGMAYIGAIQLHEEYLHSLEQTLQIAKEKLDARFGSEFVDYVVRAGHASDVLVDIAKEWDAHLIFVGSSEQPGVTLKMFGSLAQTIAFKAPCSVHAARWSVTPAKSKIPKGQRRQTARSATGPR